MRNAVAAVLCLLLAAPALAATSPAAQAWVRYGESELTAYYYDPATVRSEAQRKRVWRLFEHKEPDREGVQSGKALIEIDCRDRTYRYLRTTYYSGKMGEGKYLGGRGEHRSEHIGPGTMIHHLARAVCEPAAAPAAAALPAASAAAALPPASQPRAAR